MKVLLLALGLVAMPCLAQMASPAQPIILPEDQRATLQTSLAFAEAYSPTDLVTKAAMDSSRRSFRNEANQRPEAADMERRYPGITQRLEDAVASGVRTTYTREMPGAQRHLADVARQYFTESEMLDLVAFYHSTAGIATLRAMAGTTETVDLKGMTDANGDPQITGKDIAGVVSNSSFLGRMTAEEVNGLARFGASPSGRKMARVGPILLDEVARQTNAIVINGRGDVGAAVMEVMRQAQTSAGGGRKK